jgi:hypothetical protein
MNTKLMKAKEITKSVIKYLLIMVLIVLWAIFMGAFYIVGAFVVIPLISIMNVVSGKGLPDVSLKEAAIVYESILKETF